MSMGFKRLQGLGWVALVFLVAISLYPLSLNVGAMHARLVKVDRQIVQTRKEISYLQAEIRARASLDQLEKWNDLLYGYDAPQAAQYLSGERALADLHGGELGPQAPVLVSAAYGLNAMPIGTIGNGGRVASAADTGPAAARPEAASPAAPAKAKAETRTASAAPSPEPIAPVAVREQRVAQLESSLLGASTLRDIQARANAERAKQ